MTRALLAQHLAGRDLPFLLRVQMSWQQITPETPEEHVTHQHDMAVLQEYIQQAIAAVRSSA